MATSFRSPRKIVRRLRYLPLAARHIRNWAPFMYHYALGLVPAGPYVFRCGARVRIGRGVDHVPIIEIFLNKDYGDIPADAVIVDLGAHIGTFSVYAATRAPGCRIYAYEPMPAFRDLLEENLRLNGAEARTRCFGFAAAGHARPRELHVAGGGILFPSLVQPREAERTERLDVPCTTLAEILEGNRLTRVDLLKMDIEGAEYEVLYATPAATLAKICAIRMEYHNLDADGRNVDELRRFLGRTGYTVTHARVTSDTNGILWARRP
jgi:FkbM family methyltransferase